MTTQHVVMFSGGIGSWAAAKLVAQRHGTENLHLVFSDVKGANKSPHIGEDEDTYRFIEDAVANIGGSYVYLNEGRDIWEVFKKDRFLGNSRLANCSYFLKQKPARSWIEQNMNADSTIIYVGIDWTETHRLAAIVKNYLPFRVEAPLTEPPYLEKKQLLEWCVIEGIKPPRLYSLGFSHNNCGGGCVRAGQAQFKKLLEVMPDRYAVWEQKETEMRAYLVKDVSILSEQKNGVKRPLTLTNLRHRIETQPFLIDDLDISGCGCFFENDEVKE